MGVGGCSGRTGGSLISGAVASGMRSATGTGVSRIVSGVCSVVCSFTSNGSGRYIELGCGPKKTMATMCSSSDAPKQIAIRLICPRGISVCTPISFASRISNSIYTSAYSVVSKKTGQFVCPVFLPRSLRAFERQSISLYQNFRKRAARVTPGGSVTVIPDITASTILPPISTTTCTGGGR